MLGLEYLITQHYPLSHNVIYKCNMIPIKTPTGFWGHLTKVTKVYLEKYTQEKKRENAENKEQCGATVLRAVRTAFSS